MSHSVVPPELNQKHFSFLQHNFLIKLKLSFTICVVSTEYKSFSFYLVLHFFTLAISFLIFHIFIALYRLLLVSEMLFEILNLLKFCKKFNAYYQKINVRVGIHGDRWWHSATSQKFLVSIPDEFVFFIDIILPAVVWAWGRMSL